MRQKVSEAEFISLLRGEVASIFPTLQGVQIAEACPNLKLEFEVGYKPEDMKVVTNNIGNIKDQLKRHYIIEG